MTVRVLVADPPWKFGDALPGETRGAEKQYPCMTLEQLIKMPIPDMGPNAVLFLWRVASMQAEALELARAWGFSDPKAELVWLKYTLNWREFFGMGRYVRNSHETCLICVRGNAKPTTHSTRSTFRARVRAHSQKPERFYEIVDQLYPYAPKVELFARTVRPGWRQFGNQLGILPLERKAA